MSDRKAPGPVEQSIARLRELRYMTRGAGAKLPPRESYPEHSVMPTVEKLRKAVAAVPPTKTSAQKKAAKKRKAKRGRF